MKTFYDHWNRKIQEWYSSPQECFKNDIHSIYKGKGANELKPGFLPEPYLGEMENCSAVIINKNPGSPMCLQKHKKGRFITEDNAHLNYYEFAKSFPYLTKYIKDGGSWWQYRQNWIKRLGVYSELKPFALEVCPWHSKLFDKSGMDINDEAYLEYLNEWVIAPAEYANKLSQLGIILSVGGFFNDLYEHLGFTKVLEISDETYEEHGLNWHLNKKNNPVKVKFAVWRSFGNNYFLNFASGSGYNKVPAEKWNYIEKYILGVLKR